MRYILLLLCFVVGMTSYAQPNYRKINISPLTRNYFGTTIDITYNLQYSKNLFYAGVGYLINPPSKGVKPNALFTNKAYATNFFEHLTFKGGHELCIISRNERRARLFSFTELVIANTKIKNEDYAEALGNNSYDMDSFYVYEANFVNRVTNATFVNINLGMGFEAPVTKNLSIKARGGVSPGIVLYKFQPADKNRIWGTSISHMFYSFSINYAF